MCCLGLASAQHSSSEKSVRGLIIKRGFPLWRCRWAFLVEWSTVPPRVRRLFVHDLAYQLVAVAVAGLDALR